MDDERSIYISLYDTFLHYVFIGSIVASIVAISLNFVYVKEYDYECKRCA